MVATSRARRRFNQTRYRTNIDSDKFFIEHQRHSHDSALRIIHWKMLIYSFIILSLSIAVSAVIFSAPVSTYAYYFSRYLYFIPVLVAGFLVGRDFAVFIGFIYGAMFVPDLVRAVNETGLSPQAIELVWLIAFYNLVPLLVISLTDLRRRHTAVLNTVEQLGEIIEKSLDLNGLLALVLRQSITLLNADSGGIFVVFDETRHQQFDIDAMPQEHDAHRDTSETPTTLYEWLLHSAQDSDIVVLPNMADDQRFLLPPDLIKMRPTCVAVRLRRVGDPFGMLVLWRYAGRNFSQDEIALLRILIDKTQMAVENAWLYSRTDEALLAYAKHLTMLLEASRVFSTTSKYEELLQSLCDQLYDRAEVSACRIYLLDTEAQSLVLAATRSVSSFMSYHDIDAEFPLASLPLHRQVFQDGKPVVAFNESPEDIYSTVERTLLFGTGVKSALLMPLAAKDRYIGLIVLSERRAWERSAFSKERIERCMAIARQAALSLENIEAFDALAQQRQSIQLIIDNVTDGVFSTDLDRRITAFNPAAERITGYAADDVLGRTCNDAFKDGQNAICQLCWGTCPIQRVLADPHSRGQATHTEAVLPHIGETKRVALTIAPLNDQDAHTTGTVIVLRDVSREQELIRLKTEFISMASHQLRTPLACIRASIELLNRDDEKGNARSNRLLRTLDQQSSHLSRLVDQVLIASRLEHGQFRPVCEPLALVPLVKQLLTLYRTQHPDHTFHLETSLDQPFASGDQMSVEIILENLLGNAVKYSPSGSNITVTIRDDAAYVVIGVHDRGSGIPTDQMAYIFRPFRRLSNYMTAAADGFGLGLYIAKTLIEAQGGHISVESRQDVGTSFTFTLPRQEAFDGEGLDN